MTGYFLKLTRGCQGKTLLNESYGIVSAFRGVDNTYLPIIFEGVESVI